METVPAVDEEQNAGSRKKPGKGGDTRIEGGRCDGILERF